MVSETPKCGVYQPITRLGVGGMSDVWLGRLEYDAEVRRLCCLKYLRGEFLELPAYLDRFKREAAIGLAVTGNHPNLVTTRGYQCKHGQPMVAVDLVAGPTLGDVMDELKGSHDVVRHLAHEMLSTLMHLEAYSIAHRDISPANILFDVAGQILLGDFGLATRLDVAETPGPVLGTLAYVAPEVLDEERGSCASDAFSLGAVLYQVLTGVSPRKLQAESEDECQRHSVFPFPRRTPRDLRRVLSGLLAPEPHRRLHPQRALRLLRRYDRDRVVRTLRCAAAQWLKRKPTLQQALLQGEAISRPPTGFVELWGNAGQSRAAAPSIDWVARVQGVGWLVLAPVIALLVLGVVYFWPEAAEAPYLENFLRGGS